MSGRIRPIEYQSIASNDNSNDWQSTRKDISQPESPNSSRVTESQIFDKEPPTQIQSIVDETPKLEIIHSQIEQDFRRREMLIEKLNAIDREESIVECEAKTPLKYSYPNDGDYVTNDTSANEIETISALDTKPQTKSYIFNNAVEHLHQGIPIHSNNNDLGFKRRTSADKKKVMTSPNQNESPNPQVGTSQSQKNNSNVNQPTAEIVLPPLTETEHEHKERELMEELFGQSQSNGSSKNHPVILPWKNTSDSVKGKSDSRLQHIRPVDLSKSEEIEEIVL